MASSNPEVFGADTAAGTLAGSGLAYLAVDRANRDVHGRVHDATDLGELLALVALLRAQERR